MSKAIQHRINAGRAAILGQVDFFCRQFGRVPSEWKEDDTRVTFADFAISERIFAELRTQFPDDGFCSEESNPLDEAVPLSRGYGWILDPIDGTNNFAIGFPVCAISLALLKNGVPIYGFVWDFSRKKLIHGGPSHGVFDANESRSLKVIEHDQKLTVGLSFPISEDILPALTPALSRWRIRSTGSGTMQAAFVAIGFLDGVIDYRVKPWDIAASWALLKAAGAEVHFINGDLFPMDTFHPRMQGCPYYAGSPAFCAEVKALLCPKC